MDSVEKSFRLFVKAGEELDTTSDNVRDLSIFQKPSKEFKTYSTFLLSELIQKLLIKSKKDREAIYFTKDHYTNDDEADDVFVFFCHDSILNLSTKRDFKRRSTHYDISLLITNEEQIEEIVTSIHPSAVVELISDIVFKLYDSDNDSLDDSVYYKKSLKLIEKSLRSFESKHPGYSEKAVAPLREFLIKFEENKVLRDCDSLITHLTLYYLHQGKADEIDKRSADNWERLGIQDYGDFKSCEEVLEGLTTVFNRSSDELLHALSRAKDSNLMKFVLLTNFKEYEVLGHVDDREDVRDFTKTLSQLL